MDLVRFGVIRRFAVIAQTADQALGNDADNIAGHHIRQHADVEQARYRADRRIGV